MNFLPFLFFVFSLVSISLASYPPQEESGSGPENTFLNEGKKTQESPLQQQHEKLLAQLTPKQAEALLKFLRQDTGSKQKK